MSTTPIRSLHDFPEKPPTWETSSSDKQNSVLDYLLPKKGSFLRPYKTVEEVPEDDPGRYEGDAWRRDTRPPEYIVGQGFQPKTPPYATPEEYHNFLSHQKTSTGSLVSHAETPEAADAFGEWSQQIPDAVLKRYRYKVKLNRENSFKHSKVLGFKNLPYSEQQEVSSTGDAPDSIQSVHDVTTSHEVDLKKIPSPLKFLVTQGSPAFGGTAPFKDPKRLSERVQQHTLDLEDFKQFVADRKRYNFKQDWDSHQ